MIYTKLADTGKELLDTRSINTMTLPTTVIDMASATTSNLGDEDFSVTVLDLSNPKDVAMVTEAGFNVLDLSASSNSAISDCGSSDTVSIATDDMSDLDPEIARAAAHAAETGSLIPLIKEELKYNIQRKRLQEGKDVLKIESPKKRHKEQLTTEEELKRLRRRERNKVAAQKCRNKRKEKAGDLQEQSVNLEEANEELRSEIEKLENEKEMLFNMLRTHDICPRTCNTRLSACSDDDSDTIISRPNDRVGDELDIQMELEVVDTQAESPFSVALMGIDPVDDELHKDVFSK